MEAPHHEVEIPISESEIAQPGVEVEMVIETESELVPLVITVEPELPPSANPPAVANDDGPRSWGEYLDEQATWLESQKAVLMVVATMVAGMAYGGGLNPPGGVLSRRFSSGNRVYPEGVSVLAVNNPLAFRMFYVTNQIAFLASFSVVLMLMTGLPCNGRVRVCIITVIVTVATIAIALNSGYSIAAFTPVSYQESSDPVLKMQLYSSVGWCVLVAFIVIAHVSRLLMNMRRM